ncbi:MAG: sigma-70 family RNA polymerase sigma factor [Anaerolineales bacterium]|nr:MAG: sigma-70 family RNA polymerase sigma factor [Anaerolineales bacterium]
MVNDYGRHLSDEELVALCRQRLRGDSRPFTALVFRYQQRVLATCFRFMGNWDDAEDQAQEVFIKAYREIRRFEGRAKFSTWLFQIAVNVCRTALRRRSRRPTPAEAPLLALERLLPSSESVEEGILARAEANIVNQALQTLREDEREVLTLREAAGLTYQEIAETLDIGLSAAKMRVMRARLALRHAYLTLAGEEG